MWNHQGWLLFRTCCQQPATSVDEVTCSCKVLRPPRATAPWLGTLSSLLHIDFGLPHICSIDPALQVAAFKAGFEEVFPLRHLNAFYEDEIEAVLCGTGASLGPAQL